MYSSFVSRQFNQLYNANVTLACFNALKDTLMCCNVVIHPKSVKALCSGLKWWNIQHVLAYENILHHSQRYLELTPSVLTIWRFKCRSCSLNGLLLLSCEEPWPRTGLCKVITFIHKHPSPRRDSSLDFFSTWDKLNLTSQCIQLYSLVRPHSEWGHLNSYLLLIERRLERGIWLDDSGLGGKWWLGYIG